MAPTGTDAEGNTCTWTGCGLDSTTNAFFGGCASSTAGTICERIAPPPAYAGGCADGSVEQTFGTYTDAAGAVRRMVGCAGATTWDQRGGLCAPGWSPASADDWRIARAGQAPTHDYWTNDHLGYTGSGSGTCAAAVGSSALACPTNQPMRVCVGTAADPEGNTCTWAGCGLGTTTPSLSLGGCYSNPTAGSLCQQRVTTPVTPTVPRYAFDRAAFGASVHRALTAANPKGFQFALLDDTGASVILDRGGTATGDGTSLYVPMTDDRRIDSASMSKTITATAVVAALEDLEARGVDVSLDTAIRAYLPSNWAIPTWAYNLTFRDVLLHTSGFGDGACTSNRYEDVRTMVEHVAPTCTVGQQRCYTNCNYALLRVALAYLVDGPLAYRPFESDAAKTGAITALSYRNFIRGRVLAPIGLGAVDEYFTGTTPDTMYFHLDHSNCPMPDPDNNILTAGPGTWTLSATEYAQFLTALRRGRIVSPTAYQAMQATIVASDSSDAIGMWRHDGKLGRYYDHSGGGGYALGGWCGPVADWMIFANGYTGVYITNTANAAAPNELNFETLKSNFDAAITLLP